MFYLICHELSTPQEYVKMNSQLNSSFHITLLSGCSTNYFPENTLSKFTIKLPVTLNLFKNENWFVGITRFSCTKIKDIVYSPRNVSYEERNKIFFNKTKLTGGFSIVDLLQTVPKFLKSVEENSFFDDYISTQNEVFNPFPDIANDFIQFSAVDSKHKIKIPIHFLFTPRTLFDSYFYQIPKESRKDEVKFLKEQLIKWRNYSSKLKMNDIYEGCVSNYHHMNYLCIYSDLVEPRIIGDRLSRALYIQPIIDENKWLERQFVEINNVEYYPIEKKEISEISILIADETGEQINFNEDVFNTMVSLHFKKGI